MRYFLFPAVLLLAACHDYYPEMSIRQNQYNEIRDFCDEMAEHKIGRQVKADSLYQKEYVDEDYEKAYNKCLVDRGWRKPEKKSGTAAKE